MDGRLNVIHDPSFNSIVPIIITLILSLFTRNVIIGLFFGVLSGVCLLHGFNPLVAMDKLIGHYLVGQVSDSYNAAVIILLVFIGGFIHLIEKSGGGPAFANAVTRYINSRRKGQMFAWMGGIMLFFSDIGTPLIVGPIFQPLFDKMKLSREKLAMIVDSTASPVAILVPFIGWGVYIMSLIDKEIATLYPEVNSLEIFVSAIPFQFYAVLAVFLIPWLALSLADIGPMATAERMAAEGKATRGLVRGDAGKAPEIFTHENASSSFVFIPLFLLAATLLIVLIPLGFPGKPVPGSVFRSALSTGYFFAAVAIIILMAKNGVRPLMESISLYLKGMSRMMQIAIILVLAWTLSVIGKDLGAPAYISSIVENGFPSWLLPAIVFLLGGIISFATGSSWGTFAVLFPLVIPAAATLGAPLVVVVAAVLSGGLFGDHCSPISDSTILSSTGAGCNQFEHFRTQLPYAVLNGLVAFIVFLLAGAHPTPLLLLVAIAIQIAVFYVLARLTRSNITPHPFG